MQFVTVPIVFLDLRNCFFIEKIFYNIEYVYAISQCTHFDLQIFYFKTLKFKSMERNFKTKYTMKFKTFKH